VGLFAAVFHLRPDPGEHARFKTSGHIARNGEALRFASKILLIIPALALCAACQTATSSAPKLAPVDSTATIDALTCVSQVLGTANTPPTNTEDPGGAVIGCMQSQAFTCTDPAKAHVYCTRAGDTVDLTEITATYVSQMH
jgi:hypothetical protein